MEKNIIRINEDTLKKIVTESVKRVLKESYWDDDPEYGRKCAKIMQIAKDTLKRMGFTHFWGEMPSGLGFRVEINEFGDAQRIQNILQKVLKADSYDCHVNHQSRLSGLDFVEVYLPTPNNCGIEL